MRAVRTVAGAVAAALAGAALAACGPGGGEGAAGPTTPAAPVGSASTPADPAPGRSTNPGATASPTPGATPAATPAAGETLVRVTRTGGFAGAAHTVVVRGDGSWLRLDGAARPEGSGTLPKERLDALAAALRAADFPRLPRVATGSTTVYDGFSYTFVHAGREVFADQSSLAPALRDVLSALPPFSGG